MKGSQQIVTSKNQIRALALGLIFTVAAAGVGQAMSDLVSLSQEPVWPTSSTPDGNLVYNITTIGRSGSGLLEVTLTAGSMPPGVTVSFSPNVLRFTGNALTAQTATMTVSCPYLIPVDCYPFTITAASKRETLTITNLVLFTPQQVGSRLPTLYLDQLTGDGLRLRGLGASGGSYQILAATDLSNPVWTPLGQATADGNGRFTFFTSQMPGAKACFFRAVSLP